MQTPALSVLMGVYHPSPDLLLLRRSVVSVLAQTFAGFEFLICDDGSSDQTIAYLNQVAASDARVRLIRPGDAFLLPQKLNACLAASRGDWIARMDDDDFSHPERFARQLRFLSAHPEIAFVGSQVNLVCEGRPAGVRRFPLFPQVRDFYMTQPYIHPSLLFRRAPLEQVGGYSEDRFAVLCEDYDLLLRLYAKGFRGANLPECLLDYTIPPSAKGNRTMRHRWNETVTRWRRFRELKLLPGALPYVVKPLAVGVLPGWAVEKIRGTSK